MSAEKDHSEEIARLERRSEQDPRTHTFARLADLYRKSGDLERALRVIERGLRQHPHYLNARLVHARVLRELGRLDAARGAFEHVLRIDSENLVARAALEEMGVEGADGGRDRPRSEPSGSPPASGWLARLDADWRQAWAENGGSDSAPIALRPDATPGETSSTEGAVSGDPDAPEAPEAPDAPEATDAPSTDAVEAPEARDLPSVEEPSRDPVSPPSEPVPGGVGVRTNEPADDAGVRASEKPDGEQGAKTAPPPAPAHEPRSAGSAAMGELETATLAALYVRQGLFDRAIAIYERLLARDPYNARLASALEQSRRRSAGRQETRATSPSLRRPPAKAETARPEPHMPRSEPRTSGPGSGPVRSAMVPSEPPSLRARTSPPSDPFAEPEEGKNRPDSVRALLERILDGEQEMRPGSVGSRWPAWLERLERDDG